jgi:STE24 endopeptidase
MFNEFTVMFLAFLILGTVLQFWLARRQITFVSAHQEAVPKAFMEKITLADHQKAAAYTLAKVRHTQIMLIVDILMVLLWTLGGLLEYLDQIWRSFGWSSLWTGVAVIISMMILSALLDLPDNLYTTFRLEARFGFNRTTPSIFITDTLKSFLLLLLMGIPFTTLVLWIMEHAGPFWWLGVWIAWMAFSLLLLWAYPTFIAPLFNKFKPLDGNDELKQRIEALLQRNGFTSQGIFVMDGSTRSGHGNAYFTGLGRNKRIVFFDTLLEGLTVDEIEAVLAHEVGHFKRKHLQKGILMMGGLALVGLAVLGWLIQADWFYQGLGVSTRSNYMALLLFMLIIPVFTFFLSPVLAWVSRRHEFEADDFAAQQARPQALIQALVKLYKDNASTLTPDPLYSACYESHPPAPVRIAHLSAKLNC